MKETLREVEENQEMSEKEILHFVNELFITCHKKELSQGIDMSNEFNDVMESMFDFESIFIGFEVGETFSDLFGNEFLVLDIYEDFQGNKKAMGKLNGEFKVFTVGVCRGIFSLFCEQLVEMKNFTAEC